MSVCFKFALRFADKRMPKAMIRNGRSGWYYRVVETGVLAAGDRLDLRGRPNSGWPMARFNRLLAGKSWTIDELTELASPDLGLGRRWQGSRARSPEPPRANIRTSQANKVTAAIHVSTTSAAPQKCLPADGRCPAQGSKA